MNNNKAITLMVKQEVFKFKDAGFTQQEVADILGLSRRTVQRILKGGLDKVHEAIEDENRYIDNVLGTGCSQTMYWERDEVIMSSQDEIIDTDNYDYDPTLEAAAELEHAEQWEADLYDK